MTSLHTLLVRPDGHSAARRVRPPRSVRRLGAVLAGGVPLLLLGLLLVPWQQAALGTGRVVAFAPEERQQTVEAPLSGRVARWLVQEGQRVVAGQQLAEIVDIDPDRLSRLVQGQQAAGDQSSILDAQIRSYEAKLSAERASRDLAIAEADAKLRGLEQKRIGDRSESEVEALNATRLDALARDGIASVRDAEVARMKRDQADAALAARDREIDAQRRALGRVRTDGDAKVATVEADLEAARAKGNEALQKQLDADTRVARQQAQQITAPRDGVVLRLYGGPGGALVKEGDPLVTLVPTVQSHAVELWVDGNDMPLLESGQEVRLMFEGWPALQLPGFPGAQAGTFVGQVAFLDATDDGAGKFRLVVVPDDSAPPWPDAARLRQGVRVKGWVLLGQVRLGYELWRRTNGFPPLPSVKKGDTSIPASAKKPRIPSELK